ncbi:hypothetical protein M9H77_22369 [Catharanthus roseus]|uniref:Uncharacterized protein n=1 Tax=Catharanthus roseus TaxID=4058 RepID=A0ACC0AUA7_CATRO|nr:hypothetical protein M9H77_22369 [Catharanthus roseus]
MPGRANPSCPFAVSISVSSLSSLRSSVPLLLSDLRSLSATPPCCERLSLVVFLTIVSGEYLRESREGEEDRDTRDSCLPRLLGLGVPDLNLYTGASTLLGAAVLAVVRTPAEPTHSGGTRCGTKIGFYRSVKGEEEDIVYTSGPLIL